MSRLISVQRVLGSLWRWVLKPLTHSPCFSDCQDVNVTVGVTTPFNATRKCGSILMSLETPLKPRLTSSGLYMKGLQGAREAVLRDVAHIPQVDAATLLNAVLPEVPPSLIGAVKQQLDLLDIMGPKQPWYTFLDDSKRKEKDMFDPMREILSHLMGVTRIYADDGGESHCIQLNLRAEMATPKPR